MSEFESIINTEVLPPRYRNATFDDAMLTYDNGIVYKQCEDYVNSAQKMPNNNGLYIYGEPSTGKTHLIACICNELL